ncbi:SDR family NAD(P)-dependent oxidoreductase [Teredinibacter turnerae]|uniref:SDR family NAD(P)-dependent oxidoreductase n=1 Tax=Teredinibacter turnerae TaxID=2426 RepID=UPI001F07A649|nr:SDR family NAD(P)-dependent oxidoreductase [Teredinibacter turnerae]
MQAASLENSKGLLIIDKEGAEKSVLYKDLYTRALFVATNLKALGIASRSPLVLQCEDLTDHFTMFWGAILGGYIPVTVAIPAEYVKGNGVFDKLTNVCKLLSYPTIVCSKSNFEKLNHSFDSGGMHKLVEAGALHDPAGIDSANITDAIYPALPEDVAFYQLSSGSTGTPKCIQITHKGVIAHCEAASQFNNYSSEDVSLNWLPVDHVVPMLTMHLKSVYLKAQDIQVNTEYVLKSPFCWMRLMQDYNVSHSWSPNFAFKMARNKGFNLSHVKKIINAGEQVTEDAIAQFINEFACSGISYSTVQPSFGTAEACTCMAFVNAFDVNRHVFVADESTLGSTLRKSTHGKRFVSCGGVVPGVEIRITDNENRILNERQIGRFQVRGDVITPGYLSNPEANDEAFVGDGWYSTGDLGFISDGQLYITGREKEMIVLRGANIFCYEVEEIVSSLEGVETGFAAAFSINNSITGTEGYGIAFVGNMSANLLREIKQRLAKQLGTSPEIILSLDRCRFPRTTSGKIQRRRIAQMLVSGQLDHEVMLYELAMAEKNTLPNWFFKGVWHEESSKLEKLLVVGSKDKQDVYDYPVVWLSENYIPDEIISSFRQKVVVNKLLTPGLDDLLSEEYEGRCQPVLIVDIVDRDARRIDRTIDLCKTLCMDKYARLNVVWLRIYIEIDRCTVSADRGFLSAFVQERTSAKVVIVDAEANLDLTRAIESVTSEGEDLLIDLRFRAGRQKIFKLEAPTFNRKIQYGPKRNTQELNIVFGGLGGIGSVISQHLLKKSQQSLVVIGKSPENDRRDALAQFRHLAAEHNNEFHYIVWDANSNKTCTDILDVRVPGWHKKLANVVHSLGSYGECAVVDETIESMDRQNKAKIACTEEIERVLQKVESPEKVRVTYIGSVFGLTGFVQGAGYSYGNAFMEGTVERDINASRYVVAYGGWRQTGVNKEQKYEEFLNRKGVLQLSREQGLDSLELIWTTQEPGIYFVGLDARKRVINNLLTPRTQRNYSYCSLQLPQITNTPLINSKDYQVVSGYLVDFRHVENIVCQMHGVVACKLINIWSMDNVQQLASFLVLAPDIKPLSIKDLHDFLVGKVPAYAWPELLHVLDDKSQIDLDEKTLSDMLNKSRAAGLAYDDDDVSYVIPQMEKVRKIWASLLSMHENDIALSDSFFNLAGDSIQLVRLAEAIQQQFNVAIDVASLFEFDTLVAMSKEVSKLARKTVDLTSVDREPTNISASENGRLDNIAIVGLAGSYPKSANLKEFWDHLCSGSDLVSTVPENRWSTLENYIKNKNQAINEGKSYSKWGGFLDGAFEFDALFFNISPREAEELNPKERVALQTAWHAIEDAAYTPDSLQEFTVGCFFGVTKSGYDLYAGSQAYIANRISHHLNITGPSLTIDTACSSSLVAVHEACLNLQAGLCDMAIAGGVHLFLHPSHYSALSAGGFLSEDGRSRSFGSDANGMVPGEGSGAVVLKPLSLSRRDGDNIYAVIKGSSTNHGGKVSGFTVPSAKAHKELVLQALGRANIQADKVSYIEAHGTGTSLGDPIEIRGLSLAFKESSDAKLNCRIGSLKSNIGHLEAAAGIAGLTKVLLQMKNKTLVPSLHSARLNPHIDFSKNPFTVQQSLEPWHIGSAQDKRVAGLSSFGAGGSNAHLIVEEYQQESGIANIDNAPLPFLLSANSRIQLEIHSKNIQRYLADNTNLPLRDISYTLSVGRVAMPIRVGIIASDLDELISNIDSFISGSPSDRVFVDGSCRETLNGLERDVRAWVGGEPIDIMNHYGGQQPKRRSLPGYPFAKDVYRLDTATNGRVEQDFHKYRVYLHPLVQENTSDLSETRFSSKFDGEEYFLADHTISINGESPQKIMPGVAYIEMIYAAFKAANPRDKGEYRFAIQELTWLTPFNSSERQGLSIVLLPDDAARAHQYRVEIYSQDKAGDVIHVQARVELYFTGKIKEYDVKNIIQATESFNGSVKLAHAEIYEILNALGLVYGPRHRAVKSLVKSESSLYAWLSLPEELLSTQQEYGLHPSMLDGALQAAVILLQGDGHFLSPWVPFNLENIVVHCPTPAGALAHVRRQTGCKNKLDIDLLDYDGKLLVELTGYTAYQINSIGVTNWRTEKNAHIFYSNVDKVESHPQIHPSKTANFTHLLLTFGLSESTEAYLQRSMLDCTIKSIGKNRIVSASNYTDCMLEVFEFLKILLQDQTFLHVSVKILMSATASFFEAGFMALLRCAQRENPNLIGQVIEVDESNITSLLETLEAPLGLPHIQLRNGGLISRKWLVAGVDQSKQLSTYKENGIYVITGGMGKIGRLLAKDILEKTQSSKVVLLGRRKHEDILGFEQYVLNGLPRLSYCQVDLTQTVLLEEVICNIVTNVGRITGVIHCAGLNKDNFIVKKSSREFESVLEPKVEALASLDYATRDSQLDFFILFSSFVARTGNAGQSDYATANAFLDEFARQRNELVAERKRTGKSLSIAWSLWADGGMGNSSDEAELVAENLYVNFGIAPISTEAAVAAFHLSIHFAMEHSIDHIIVAKGDATRIQNSLNGYDTYEVSARLLNQTLHSVGTNSNKTYESTLNYLTELFSRIIKIPLDKLSENTTFDQYGMNSMLAMALTNELEAAIGTLPKTLFFEYQSLAELTEYFIERHATKLAGIIRQPVAEEEQSGPNNSVCSTSKADAAFQVMSFRNRSNLSASERSQDKAAPASIAIIGLSGRYPESGDISSYWSNLASGRDCIREVPLSRWDWRDYYSEDRSQGGSHYSKWGGFIDGVDEFDPRFFNISPKEAVTLDPQERLFLQHAWMAVEDAGYTRARLQVAHGERQAGQVGVYVGVMYNEYQLLGAESSLRGQRMGFASTPASIANRVSYVLNVHGPSMTVDTMCSSSLTAIHLACQDLRIGRTDLALAGGVNVTIHPNKYLMLSAGQFISSDGHCQSFGEGGDGYIPGEGVGAVLLKPLAQAEADGDPIHGVIRGSALNHGGRTNGYSVPNPKAQACAIAQALDDAQVDPRHISYLEAHGTGTQLGDPVEIAGLSKAFYRGVAEAEQARGYCRLGSAKSNIGHGEAAAGIAGLTKILLQMRHRQIVPSLHSQRLNPNIDFAETPFIVNQTLTAWEAPVVDGREQPRLAGLSSFGAGGANAHMIVEEYPALAAEIESEAISATPTIVPLSARTAEQLQDKAQDLLTFIEASPATELAALAYTCQVGRDAMDERLCVVVDSIAQLRASLQAYCAGRTDVEGVYQGQVKAHRERVSALSQDDDMQGTLAHWLADRKLGPLADLWVKGLTIDWSALYAGQVPRRLHLPTYPFARERYWIETDTTALHLVTGAMHPLLQRNTSTLQQHSYHSEFKGTEFFYTPGESRMPEAVYLAMARAAVEHGLASAGESEVIELFDLAWGIPAHARGLSIALFNLVVDRDNTAQVDFEIYSQVDKQEAIDAIHCQGRARRGQRVLPPAVDLGAIQARCQPLALTTAPAHVTALYHEGSQLMATLTLPELMHGSLEQYPLHPQILQGALATVADWLVAQGMAPAGLLPQSLSSLTLYFACCENMVLWARYTGRNETALQVDISVCDAQGRVYLQLHGLSYALPATTTALSSADVVDELATDAEGAQVSKAPITVPTRIEIALPRSTSPEAVVSVLAKPQGIPLVAVEDVRDLAPAPLVHPTIPLAAPSSQWPVGAPRTPAVDDVYLEDLGQGIYRLTLQSSTPTAALMDTLDHALDVLGARENVKVLLFCGHGNAPLQGDRRNPQWLGLCQRISALPQPTLAVLPGGAEGAGLLLGAVCDVMICSEQAPYGLGDALAPSAGDQAFWEGRFGAALAAEILWTTARASGQDWQRKGWTCPILASDAIEAYALAWATHLAGKSVEALQQLKPHLTQARQGWITALAATPAERALPASPSEPPSPDSVAGEGLQVSVVGHTLQVTLADTRSPHALTGLGAVLAQGASAGYRSVVLSGALFAGADEATPSAEIATLIHSLLGSPLWIVAALEGDARGLAWLLAQCCDSVIHSTEGVYGIDALWHQGPWASWAVAVLDQRLGQSLSQRLMLSPDGLSGHELPRIAHWHVTSSDAVTVEAQQVASTWAERQPHADWQQALATWKGAREQAITHAQTTLSAMSTEDDVAEATRDQGIPAQDGQTIPLQSPVIEVVAYPQGIVHIRMVDRAAKNLFSPAFVAGMDEAFAHIRDHGQYKVVVLSGYDQYFASGGTKDTLLAIQRGEAQFTDITVYQRPLDCDLPVVAAMQGHAIGAGWALGMFADVVLFSDESHYVSPYMNYGFTPGAGSTTLLPYKLGQDLAFDSLLSGQPFDGRALHARGLPYTVLPRHRLEMTAHQWAGQLAQASRAQLMALKDYWRQGIAPALAETYAQELAMHEATFVGQDATLAQIQAQFGAGEASEQPAAPAAPARAASAQSVLSTLKTLLAKELHMGSDELDQDEQFVDLGLDSITGVTWVRAINAQYQLDIEATKVYSYPTLQAFSRYVSEIVAEQAPVSEPEEPTPAALDAPSPSAATAIGAPRAWSDVSAQVLTSWRHALPSVASSARPPEAIAIVGMAGQFASTNSLADYWRAIAAGEDCIREVSAERWSIDQYYQPGETPAAGKTNSKWLGGLTHYDGFDPLFFNLSPKEAMSMDPQQRVFLQACWNSIEDAGYQAQSLSGSRCGVFVGCASAGYQLLSRELQLSAQGFTGEASSILAARIAYYLNLQGPCLSIDTACSSSLVAIAQACDSLRHGDSDMALAGGVYVMSGPELHIKSAQAGMLSPDGRCFTFDQRANGFVPGEGVGVVMLKRLSDAERDGDSIHAVLRGWGVNQDGKTNGITAPSAQSQTRLQRSIYDKFAIDPTNIQLVEAHGTGTPLGDPIEVEGLRHAFGAYTDKTDYCALGSVKSNIGHCLAAAGIAGVLKVVLALKHRQLPPTLHVQQVNEHIGLSGSPFYINDRLRSWDVGNGQSRQGAVSSFGFSGTNAHVVVAEAPATSSQQPARSDTPRGPVVIPLSAKTPEQLNQRMQDLIGFLDQTNHKTLSLSRLAYTLQTGRDAMDERLCLVANSVNQLRSQLQITWEAASQDHPDYTVLEDQGIYRASVKSHRQGIDFLSQDPQIQATLLAQWRANNQLTTIAQMWSKGLAIDWQTLNDNAYQRMHLPSYPFSNERFWVDELERRRSVPLCTIEMGKNDGHRSPVIHRLLHSNISKLGQQEYRSTFTIADDFLQEKTAEGLQDALLGIYLSMARAAILDATSVQKSTEPHVQLENVLWCCSDALKTETIDIHIAVFNGQDNKLAFELFIYNEQQGEVILCQGNASVLSCLPINSSVDLNKVKTEIEKGASAHRLLEIPIKSENNSISNDSAWNLWVLNRVLRLACSTLECGSISLNGGALANYLVCEQLSVHESVESDVYLHLDQSDKETVSLTIVNKQGSVLASIKDLSLGVNANAALDDRWQGQINLTDKYNKDAGADTDDASSLHDGVIEYLRVSLAEALYLSVDDIDLDTQFAELGVDSIIAVEWAASVNKKFKTEILVTTFYQYSTIKVLTEYIVSVLLHKDRHNSSSSGNLQEIVIKDVLLEPTPTENSDQKSTDNKISAELLRVELISSLAEALYLGESDIDSDVEFVELGMDSIVAVEWVSSINKKYGTEILVTSFYQYPTINKLQPYLLSKISVNDSFGEIKNGRSEQRINESIDGLKADLQKNFEPKRDAKLTTKQLPLTLESRRNKKRTNSVIYRPHNRHTESVAIVGMAGLFPKAKNIDQYWQNIASGRDCISEVSSKRWPIEAYYQASDRPTAGKCNSKWIGEIEDADMFDPLFFSISPTEAEIIDPQQRLFMQSCWHAIEHAGYNPNDFSGQKCGVFVGCGPGDYMQFAAGQQFSAQALTGGATSILAARIAYYLNLKGPCISIDTACSSSLVAIANACDSLTLGDSEIALAGGVCLLSGPSMHIMTSQSGMLSPNGKCFTFDERANGFVPGEGVGVLVLKRLSDAVDCQDRVHSVIKGWGVNQDGKTNGITAPNPESQTRLQRDVYSKFNIKPDDISLIEAHGTGTKLGDPVEIEGIKASFNLGEPESQRCALGSVKSNIGHTLAAAGVAGVIKLVLSIKHQQLPPTINFEKQNSHIHLEGTRFFVNDKLQPWVTKPGVERRAAINSFGFSGTNAHLVLAEHVVEQEISCLPEVVFPNSGYAIVLSARTSEQLVQIANELAMYLNDAADVHLAQLAYTLQVGRAPMNERIAFVVESKMQLIEKLGDYIAGKKTNSGFFAGQVSRNVDSISVLNSDEDTDNLIKQWLERGKLHKLLSLWVKGLSFDWKILYGHKKYSRCDLPLYPFALERYWISDATGSIEGKSSDTSKKLQIHSMLHSNISDFYQQRYVTKLTGQEFFLRDHVVLDEAGLSSKVLPGVAYLEMGLAAVCNSLKLDRCDQFFTINNVAWLQPIIIEQERSVFVELSPLSSTEGRIQFEIYSQREEELDLHCSGHVSIYEKQPLPETDKFDFHGESEIKRIEKNEIYQKFLRLGIKYGATHQGLEYIETDFAQARALVVLPGSLDTSLDDYQLHPAVLDSALQTCVALEGSNASPPRLALPFSMESVEIYSSSKKRMKVWARLSELNGSGGDVVKYDVDICDEHGHACIRIKGFSMRGQKKSDLKLESKNNGLITKPISASESSSFDELFYAQLVERVVKKEISADDAAELG